MLQSPPLSQIHFHCPPFSKFASAVLSLTIYCCLSQSQTASQIQPIPLPCYLVLAVQHLHNQVEDGGIRLGS